MNARRGLKSLAAAALGWSGAREAIAAGRRRAAGGRRVLVFGYHRVCEDFARERQSTIESCLISRATFAQHVELLAGRFELAHMTRAVEVLSGRATAARDLAVITFDDGYRDVLENAMPVLREAHAPATLFVSSDVVTGAGHFPHDRLFTLLLLWERSSALLYPDLSPPAREMLAHLPHAGGPRAWLHQLIAERTPAQLERLIDELSGAARIRIRPPATTSALDWDGVRALAAAGWEIGAHTTGHCVLTHLSAEAMERDLYACRDAIAQATHRDVRHFAYCNGYYNETVIAALRRTGFASAVTTEDRLNRLGDDPYRIARRVLWEGSAAGVFDRTSPALLACQLDDAWSALGFNASESGFRPNRAVDDPSSGERRLA